MASTKRRRANSAATVKIGPRDVRHLKRLREQLSAESGRRLTPEETLSLVLARADLAAVLLAADLAAPDFPLSDEQLDRLERSRRGFGRPILDRGVDAVVYE